MTTIRIGVVADMRRLQQGEQLADKVDATVLSFDDGALGCTKNHLKVWTKLQQHGGDWLVVLEDDAIPCDGFREQLAAALADPPADIVGLYLGQGYPKPWQRFIKKALTNEDANYIVSSHLLHCVGTAVRAHLVDDMLGYVGWMSQDQRQWPIDEQITYWARLRGHRVTYTRPSLIEHADGESLQVHPDGDVRELPRVAHEFGTRNTWDRTKQAEMP